MKKVLISIISGIILSLVILISAPTHISADTLKVGILADNKPYSYLTNKKVTGFEVELSKKIAQEMDANIKFVKVSDRKKLQKLVSEYQIDLALGQFDKTTLSSKLITTDTYLYPQNVLFTGTHRYISSVEDLQNKKVGILANGNQHQLLTSLQMKPKVYNSISSLMKALENKKIKAGILTDYEYTAYLNKHPELTSAYLQALNSTKKSDLPKLTLTRIKDPQITSQQLVGITDKRNTKLNQALDKLKDGNDIIDLSQKYFSQDLTKP